MGSGRCDAPLSYVSRGAFGSGGTHFCYGHCASVSLRIACGIHVRFWLECLLSMGDMRMGTDGGGDILAQLGNLLHVDPGPLPGPAAVRRLPFKKTGELFWNQNN